MTFTYTLAWWHIPLLVTILGVIWTGYWLARDIREGGMFMGIGGMLASIPALIVALLAWMIGGLYK